MHANAAWWVREEGTATTATATSTPTKTPTPVADLSLTKEYDSNFGLDCSIVPSTCIVTWHIAVTNHGPDTATGVTVLDTPITGTTFSETHSQGTTNFVLGASTLTWSVGTLTNGSTATLDLVTDEGGGFPLNVENVAQVQASDQFDPDSTPGNGVKNSCTPTQTLTEEDDYNDVCVQTD